MNQEPQPQIDPRALRSWAGLVMVAALATRIGFLLSGPDRDWPHNTLYEGDAPLWARYAAAIQQDEPFELGLPIHPPGMGYLLSACQHLGIGGFSGLKFIFCIVGSLSCALVVRPVARMCGMAVGIAGGLLSAASFGLIVQSTSLNSETPYTLLLLLSILLTERAAASPSSLLPARLGTRGKRGLAPRQTRLSRSKSADSAVPDPFCHSLLGAVHGLAVLFRPEHTLFVVLSLGWLALRRMSGDSARMRSMGRSAIAPLPVVLAAFVLLPMPWNIRSYFAIQRFNTVEPAMIDFARAQIPWQPEAIELIRSLPAFAREGNFRYLAHLAGEQGRSVVDAAFVRWFFDEHMGHRPRPLSPLVFVSMQGPLSFALANNELATGGFSTRLLDPNAVVELQLGNPRHLRLVQDGYAVGLSYLLDHPADAIRLIGRKLWIFCQGLGSGFIAWNLPLGLGGLRRPVDQWVAEPAARLNITWTMLSIALGLLGILACIRRGIGALWMLAILYKLLVTALFYGYARQAVSILPIWYLFVAVGLAQLAGGSRKLVRGRAKVPAGSSPKIRSDADPRVRSGDAAMLFAGGRAKILIAPLFSGPIPRLARNVLITASLALILAGAISARESRRYDVQGPIDLAPQWGEAAFESHQPLWIRRL